MNRKVWLWIAVAGFSLGTAAVIAGAAVPRLSSTDIALPVIVGMGASLVGVFMFVIADR